MLSLHRLKVKGKDQHPRLSLTSTRPQWHAGVHRHKTLHTHTLYMESKLIYAKFLGCYSVIITTAFHTFLSYIQRISLPYRSVSYNSKLSEVSSRLHIIWSNLILYK